MSHKTAQELEARVRAAEASARAARALAARLKREVAYAAGARADAAAKVAGAALLSWCASDDRVRASAVRYVQDHVTSAADRAALVGTPLDVSGYPVVAAGEAE